MIVFYIANHQYIYTFTIFIYLYIYTIFIYLYIYNIYVIYNYIRTRPSKMKDMIIINILRREMRGENESKEKWQKSSPLESAARMGRREYRDRIRSLIVIRIPRYNCSRKLSSNKQNFFKSYFAIVYYIILCHLKRLKEAQKLFFHFRLIPSWRFSILQGKFNAITFFWRFVKYIKCAHELNI